MYRVILLKTNVLQYSEISCMCKTQRDRFKNLLVHRLKMYQDSTGIKVYILNKFNNLVENKFHCIPITMELVYTRSSIYTQNS